MKISISVRLIAVAATALTCIAGEPFELSWYTIDGGGVMRSGSEDGHFMLSGTIGQTDAGDMAGGNFKLSGGFWFETPPGDCNADGVPNVVDHEAFVDCLTGPAEGVTVDCECFDVDLSGTIDVADFAKIQQTFLGD